VILPLALGGRATWYLTRGAGTVTLVLLTLSVVLGIVGSVRWSAPPRWPRFVLDALHRNVSLLVLLVLAIHVITSVLDSFAPIGLADAVVPFISPYRPLWVGLGALALDLLVAVAITSVLRQRLGFRAWRSVHWLAYACWPVALLHGLGTGTDTNVSWMLVVTSACVGATVLAVVWRILRSSPRMPEAKTFGLAVTAVTVAGVAAFAVAGPLSHDWARRSGTPAALLGGGTIAPVAARTAPAAFAIPFTARLSGVERRGGSPGDGTAVVDLRMSMSGGASGTLHVRIVGSPLPNGGVSMTTSQVAVGPSPSPGLYRGRITALQGSTFAARVAGPPGDAIDLRGSLELGSGGSVNGVVRAVRAGDRGGG
jgi:sulfoxide reductase heme-binding subunit YedZ